MEKSELIDLLNYDLWASKRLLLTLKETDKPIEQKVLELFYHIFGAQKLWLGRMSSFFFKEEFKNTIPPTPNPISVQDLLESSEKNHLLLDQLVDRLVENLGEQSLHKNVTYQDMKGEDFINVCSEIFSHLIFHGTHHRAQIALLMRQMELNPPPIDYIYYVRRKK